MKFAKGSERFLSAVQVSKHVSYKVISVMLSSFLLFAVVSFSVQYFNLPSTCFTKPFLNFSCVALIRMKNAKTLPSSLPSQIKSN